MKHYKGKSIEAIQVIDEFDLNFNLGNVVKYILRCNKKGDKLNDLNKAITYINFEIKKIKDKK